MTLSFAQHVIDATRVCLRIEQDMIIPLSLLVLIVGLLMYLMSKNNPDSKAVGFGMFQVGLLVFLWNSDKILSFFR